MPSAEKIDSMSEINSMASMIAANAVEFYKQYPCGLKFKPENVGLGIKLMLAHQREGFKSNDNVEIKAVWNSVINCTPKTCNSGFTGFNEFHQYYFRYLFRICHAKYLASVGNDKEFSVYLNDNEKVRRIIRPRFGSRIAPLIKLNTEVFNQCKKLLI